MAGSDKKLTENQAEQLKRLKSKMAEGKLTEKQKSELRRLSDIEHGNNSMYIPETAKKMLRAYAIKKMYGDRYYVKSNEDFSAAIKGTQTENIALEMVNELYGNKYHRNKARVSNFYLTGILDATDGPTIEESTSILEIKTSFDLPTYIRTVMLGVPASHYWQAQGYMYITGKELVEIAYVLTPQTDDVIEQQMQLMMEKHRIGDTLSNFFNKEWDRALLHLKNYDIPLNEKVLLKKVHKNDQHIAMISKRVDAAWLYMIDFAREFKKSFQ